MPSDAKLWFELAPVAMVVLDRELRVIGANRHYSALTGTTLESLLGRHLLAAFPNDPDDPNNESRRMLEQSLQKVLRTRERDHLAHIPYRVPRAPGSPPELRVWSATHVPVLDDNGDVEAILQHTQDVTQLDSSQAANVLQRAEAVQREASVLDRALGDMRAMVDQAPGFMAFLDGPEHVFTVVNEAYTQLVGGRDVLGMPVREALPDTVSQGYPDLLDRVFRSGEPFFGQGHGVRLLDKTGASRTRVLDFVYQPIRAVDGRVVGILVQGHDLTDQAWVLERDRFRARVSQILAAAGEDVIAALPGVAHEAVVGLADFATIDLFEDGQHRRIVSAHRHPEDAGLAAELMKYPLPGRIPAGQVVQGQTSVPLVVPELTPQLLEVAARGEDHRALLEKLHIKSVLNIPLWTHGTLYGVLAMLTTARSDRGFDQHDLPPLGELGVVVATALENARLMREREKALREAEAASRAKDDFLAMLGHELRNPLAPILAATTLMKAKSPASVRELEIIERQATHLTRLVDDMLDVSAIVRGKIDMRRAPVELRTVVDKAVEIAGGLMRERKHTLTVSVPDALVVDGDEQRLAQVVANLLTNAARYTPPGGHVWVAAAAEGAGHQKNARLEVRDDGVGIAPEVLGTVFDMFVQAPQPTDRPSGGLGLGLTLVRRIVELHQGTVTVASEGLGHGTRATVVLPLIDARPAPEASATALPGAAKKILVVDDNTDAAELLAELLSSFGHETQVSPDGPSALEALRREPIDVAIVDLGLPGMSGLDLARGAKAALGAKMPRLIALTGYGTPEDRARCLAAGFREHFSKPVALAQLLRAIDEE